MYVYNILRGIEDAWQEKKSFDWGKLFDFAKEYINKPDFWKEAEETQGEDWLVTYDWIINVIADLIKNGTRDDSWAFADYYLDIAEKLLDTMIDKLPVKKEEDYSDVVTLALNTSYGRLTRDCQVFS